jgi:hypothetical protein
MGIGKNLKTSFVFHFFPMSHIISLPNAIFDFEQYEKESIGAAWARFLALIHADLDLSLPDGILLRLFCLGIKTHADLCLDMTVGARFTHKPMTEQVKFLENFLESYTSTIMRHKTLQAKVMLSVEESSSVESKHIPSLGSTYEPSPGPRTPKERLIYPSEFPIKFGDFGNTSKCFGHEKLPCPIKEVFLKIEPSKEWLLGIKMFFQSNSDSFTFHDHVLFIKGNKHRSPAQPHSQNQYHVRIPYQKSFG